MFRLIILLLVVTASGCAGQYDPSRIAILKNPKTNQTVECRVDPGGSFNFKTQVDTCISTYKKAGYVLVADSADEK